MSADLPVLERPTLQRLTRLFGRIGNTTLGGGDPTMIILQREFAARRWLSNPQSSLVYALSRITPGTNLLAFCAGSGWSMLGRAGALAAVLAVTVPSAVLVVLLTRLMEWGANHAAIAAALKGAVAAAIGMMAAACFLILRAQSASGWLLPLLSAVTAFALARFLGLTPLQILALAAVAGVLWNRP